MEKYHKQVIEYLIKNSLGPTLTLKIAAGLATERPDLFMEYAIGTIDEHIIEFLKKGQKIHAIKWYRTETGEGLKDAKDYVEYIEKQMT